jgi:two-component system cell cycle response regulator
MTKNGRRISLLMEGYPRKGFQVYSIILRSGRQGVCVSRLHPEYVEQKFDMPKARCYWLSSCRGKDVLSPKMLGSVSKAIFGSLTEDTVVFLDGLEYILLYNEMNKVLTFLKEIEASLAKVGAEMLVSIDPLTFEPRELDRLYAEFPRVTAEEISPAFSSQPQQTVSIVPLSAGQTV